GRAAMALEQLDESVLVDPSSTGAFRSIGEALRKAPGAKIIRLRPGQYVEANLKIERPLQILGDGPREEIVLILQTPLRLDSNEITLRGLTLVGRNPQTESPTPEHCAIYISAGSPLLAECDIRSGTGSCVGIAGKDSRPSLRDCRLLDAADSGVLVAEGARPVLE